MKGYGLSALLGTLLILSGCAGLFGEGSPPTRYFIISPLTLSDSSKLEQSTDREIELGVEPLSIPAYLDRAQIVIQSSASELNISEFNQWGENLRDNLSRVLVENLSLLLDSDQIYLLPGFKRRKPDFRATVRILQFELGEDETMQLTVRWKLYGPDGKQVLFREGIVLAGAKVARGDYPAIARAMSDLLAEFTRRMADAILRQKLPETG